MSSVTNYLDFRRLIQQQRRMSEVELGAYTIRTHGAAVARNHAYDWLILVLLVVLEVVLLFIHPFHRFVGKDMMEDLKYPMKENTIPFWAVPIYSFVLPICIFFVIYLRRGGNVYDLHHGVLGLLFSVLVTAVLTDAIKDAVGRPRPDFFWRCFPDGKDKYDQWGDVICHGNASDIREGHKSFPSGHTSASFAGLGFLSLYLAGKIKVFDHNGHVAKLCIVVLPLLVAALVGISRVDDYWHHWTDVFAGGLLGLTVATFCYRQFYPSPYSDEAWRPFAYSEARTQSSTNATQTANQYNVQAMDTVVHAVNTPSGQNGESYASLPLSSESVSKFEDVELGRK